MELGIMTVAAITVICYMVGMVVKASAFNDKYIPIACGLAGGALGIVCLLIGMPEVPAGDPVSAIAVGIVSGLAATGTHQIGKQLTK